MRNVGVSALLHLLLLLGLPWALTLVWPEDAEGPGTAEESGKRVDGIVGEPRRAEDGSETSLAVVLQRSEAPVRETPAVEKRVSRPTPAEPPRETAQEQVAAAVVETPPVPSPARQEAPAVSEVLPTPTQAQNEAPTAESEVGTLPAVVEVSTDVAAAAPAEAMPQQHATPVEQASTVEARQAALEAVTNEELLQRQVLMAETTTAAEQKPVHVASAEMVRPSQEALQAQERPPRDPSLSQRASTPAVAATAEDAASTKLLAGQSSTVPAGDGRGDLGDPSLSGSGDVTMLVQERVSWVAALLSPTLVRAAGREAKAEVRLSVDARGYIREVVLDTPTGAVPLDANIDAVLRLAEPYPAFDGYLAVDIPFVVVSPLPPSPLW